MDWSRVGATVRALRIRSGLTQAELARKTGVPRSAISAIERGRIDEVRIADLERVIGALGASLDVRVRWRGERLDRLLDEAHARTVAVALKRLQRLGWTTAIEVSFSIWGERGSIDILAWHSPTRTVLVVEVKSVLADIQSLLHGLDRKARLASEIAAGRGWRAGSVARIVVVAESPTSRGRVRRHGSILDVALPLRGPALRRWLRAPTGPMSGLMFLSNAAHAGTNTPLWRRERAHPASSRPRRSKHPATPPTQEMHETPSGIDANREGDDV